MVKNPEITANGRERPIIGVDGCKGGWIAVYIAADDIGAVQTEIFEDFQNLIDAFAPEAIIAVDMPIGLPERAIGGGRAPDWAAREFLSLRRASVFPVPSRRTVYAFAQGYAQACELARATSDPPKAFSKQAFWIFPRIQQVDLALRSDFSLRRRVFEVHPEVSFALMNGGTPLEAKKLKGRLNAQGIERRKALLAKQGFAADFLDAKPPRGAAWDDFYDACACAWSGRRILRREARVFPPKPGVDAEGLPVAIWA